MYAAFKQWVAVQRNAFNELSIAERRRRARVLLNVLVTGVAFSIGYLYGDFASRMRHLSDQSTAMTEMYGRLNELTMEGVRLAAAHDALKEALEARYAADAQALASALATKTEAPAEPPAEK